jgi:hypothetical protein
MKPAAVFISGAVANPSTTRADLQPLWLSPSVIARTPNGPPGWRN